MHRLVAFRAIWISSKLWGYKSLRTGLPQHWPCKDQCRLCWKLWLQLRQPLWKCLVSLKAQGVWEFLVSWPVVLHIRSCGLLFQQRNPAYGYTFRDTKLWSYSLLGVKGIAALDPWRMLWPNGLWSPYWKLAPSRHRWNFRWTPQEQLELLLWCESSWRTCPSQTRRKSRSEFYKEKGRWQTNICCLGQQATRWRCQLGPIQTRPYKVSLSYLWKQAGFHCHVSKWIGANKKQRVLPAQSLSLLPQSQHCGEVLHEKLGPPGCLQVESSERATRTKWKHAPLQFFYHCTSF